MPLGKPLTTATPAPLSVGSTDPIITGSAILPSATHYNSDSAYFIADPTARLTVEDELILNGGVLQVVDNVLELNGMPIGGGGGVDTVAAGAGLVVSPNVGNVVVSMPNVGTSGTVNNIADITTDNQGRVVGLVSYGYTPQSAAQVSAAVAAGVAPYAPLAGANFTGPVNVPAPVSGSNATTIAFTESTYAKKSGATFTGPVDTTATTLTVAAPVADAQAATKLYVDNAVAGITPGGAVNTVVGGSNISVNSASAANPVVNLDITSALDMQTNEINNCGNIRAPIGGQMDIVAGEINLIQSATGLRSGTTFPTPTVMNLEAGGAIGLDAGGAVYMVAGGVVNMSAVGSASIFATGVGPLAGEIMLGGPINHITIENDGRSMSNVADLKATGTLSGNAAVITGIVGAGSVNATSNITSLNGSIYAPNTGLGQGIIEAGVKMVAPLGDFDSTFTGNIQLGSNAGVNELTIVSNQPASHIITAIEEGAAVGQVAGGVLDTRLNPLQASLSNNTLSLVAKNGANSNVTMATVDLAPALGAYVPIAGNAGNPMTGPLQVQDSTNIEAKNITTALITPLPSVGYISALGPMQVEGGNFLVANGTATEIGLAATATPAPGQVATIQYNYAADDLLHFNKSLEAPGAVLDGNDVVPLLTFKDARTFYVSKQGNDANDGSANAPFLTVQAAVTAAIAAGEQAVLEIAPGTYNENITIPSVAGLVLQGTLAADRCVEGTILSGTIAIQCNTTDNLNNNQVVIADCFVAGHIHDTSTKEHTLIVQNCRIEGNAANAGQAVLVQSTATDMRTVVQNCVITQEIGTTGLSAVVSANVGWLNVYECDITARADGCCIDVHGSCWLQRLSQSALASTSASATPNALLFLNSTSSLSHAISLTTFAYNVATSKTSPGILATRPSPGVISATVASCVFALAGTLAAGNVIQYGAGTTLVLLIAENRSLNTPAAAFASQIQSGSVVYPLSQVGESTVTTLNGLSNAVTLAAGSNVAFQTVGNTITISGTKNGTLTGVSAGTAISVDNTNPAVPVISNTGVTQLIAGSNVTLSSETGSITISATGGGGGGGGIDTVSGGAGISVDATDPQNVIVSNTGVLSLTAQGGITNVGTAQAPIIQLSGTGTITTDTVDAGAVNTTDLTSVNFPTVPGSALPTTDRQLVPKAYVDGQSYGVQSVTASGPSIEVGGSASAVTLAVAASGVVGGTYSNATVEVGADGRVISASSGAAPVLSVTAGDGSISVGGSAANPTVAVAASGVVPGPYTYASLTVGADGRLTACSSGAPPAINSFTASTGLSNSGTSTDIVLVNTGLVTATASNGISISGSVGTNLDIVNTGLRTLAAADGSITVAGTSNDPTVALPAQTITPTAYTWPALTVNNKGVITAISENSVPFTTINGSLNRIAVSGSPGTATVDLALLFAGTSNYTFPSAVSVDGYGRIASITNGSNPATTYLALAGGTMTGAINMGAQAITNAGTITAATTNTTALSLPNAGAGTGTAFITALQTDTSAAPTNNLFITQTSGALSVFKPLANPVIQYLAGAAAGLYTYLVPQFYGERHVFSGTNVAPTLFYNTSNNYTVGGNSIALNPFYVELTNASANTITVQVRYPGALAVFPPASTAPTTTPIAGTWTAQSITIIGGTSTTTPTLASGATRRLFFNGTGWFLQ